MTGSSEKPTGEREHCTDLPRLVVLVCVCVCACVCVWGGGVLVCVCGCVCVGVCAASSLCHLSKARSHFQLAVRAHAGSCIRQSHRMPQLAHGFSFQPSLCTSGPLGSPPPLSFRSE